MASQSFVDGSTLTAASWFNDVDSFVYSRLTSVSGTNTIVGTGPTSMTAYAAGQRFTFVPANTVSGASTVNITPSGGAALGAKNIYFNGAALAGGEIRQNQPCEIYYDGTQFNLIGPFTGGAVAGPITASGIATFTAAGLAVPSAGSTGQVCSLTYTPTLTHVTNVSASVARICTVLRVGNAVFVSGSCDVDPTGAGALELGISLPIASAFAGFFDCSGAGSAITSTESFGFQSDSVNDRAAMVGIAVDTALHSVKFQFSYLVI